MADHNVSGRRSPKALLAIVAAVSLTAGACSGSSKTPNFSLNGLKVGYAQQIDTLNVVDQWWVRQLRGKVVTLPENRTVVQAVSQGLVDIGNTQFNDFALGVAQPALSNIVVLYMAEQTIPFIFAGVSSINSLGDLAGKTVGYNSTGSLTEILPRLLVRQYDPSLESKIRWRIVPESPNRAIALRAGRLDAAVLDYPDFVKLQQQGTKLTTLGVWKDLTGDANEAVNGVWIVRRDVFDQNRSTMERLARMIQGAYDRFYADKAAWISLANVILPGDYDSASLSGTYDFYTQLQMYPKSGTDPFPLSRLQALNKFFTSAGIIKLPVSSRFIEFGLIRSVAQSASP